MTIDLRALLSRRPVLLAPMEEVSDAPFRAVCRDRGADACVTEFALADALVSGERMAQRKISLAPGDTPTAIQIYGADPRTLEQAAAIAEPSAPAWLDINCGCWVPKVARGGAGAGWLRDPDAMVAMAARIVKRVRLPVTVKTRIGWGDEAQMPIVTLARRLEDAGVAAITVHCRTAVMGHDGEADWRWAEAVQAAVAIPVVLNGDVRSGQDARRALHQTGCAAVMIGRRAIEHPWIFREARAAIDGVPCPPPTESERLALVADHLRAMARERPGKGPLRSIKRHLPGYLKGITDVRTLSRRITDSADLASALAVLDEARADLAA